MYKSSTLSLRPSRGDAAILAAAWLFALGGLAWAVYTYLPGGVDWYNTYRPSALALLELQPYRVEIFHSPPWATLPLLPLAVLPERVGYAINFVLCLFVTGAAARKLGAGWPAVAIVLTSYPVLFCAFYGNIDWLVWLAVLLPPRWGLFLLAIKPQDSLGLGLYWLAESWRAGRLRQVVMTFAPVAAALALSVWAWGPWYLSGLGEIGKSFSASLWPQSLPIGLVVLLSAIQARHAGRALASSPMFAPYVTPGGWGSSLLGLADRPALLAAASAGIWIVRILEGRFL